MHWRNWIFLGIAATIAVVTIEGARNRTTTIQRHSINPDDRKPVWYEPKETRPAEKKPSEPIGPG
jgi:hypothetical protein